MKKNFKNTIIDKLKENIKMTIYKNNFFYTFTKKELKQLFTSSYLYCITLFFILSSGFFFIGSNIWLNKNSSDLSSFFLNLSIICTIIIPIMTMNVWSEEKKQNTDKLLVLFPINIRTIVLGKFFSLIIAWTFILFFTMLIPLSVIELIYFNNMTFIISCSAVFFFGIGIISISLCLSAISKYPAINFLLSFLIIIFFILITPIIYKLNTNSIFKNIFKYFSFTYHFENSARGIFDSADFIFYILLTVIGIEINIFILSYKRSYII